MAFLSFNEKLDWIILPCCYLNDGDIYYFKSQSFVSQKYILFVRMLFDY